MPIDVLSDYITDEGKTVRFAGARDVAEFAAGSEQAQNGFIEQLFNQVVKQPMLAYGANTMTRLRQSFIASDFNMQKLLVEIVTTSALQGMEKSPKTGPVTRVVVTGPWLALLRALREEAPAIDIAIPARCAIG